MAIRLATMAGLHKDGTIFGLPPVDVHVRRLIWQQLSFLDYRTVRVKPSFSTYCFILSLHHWSTMRYLVS